MPGTEVGTGSHQEHYMVPSPFREDRHVDRQLQYVMRSIATEANHDLLRREDLSSLRRTLTMGRVLVKIKNKIKRSPDFVRASDEESCGEKHWGQSGISVPQLVFDAPTSVLYLCEWPCHSSNMGAGKPKPLHSRIRRAEWGAVRMGYSRKLVLVQWKK